LRFDGVVSNDQYNGPGASGNDFRGMYVSSNDIDGIYIFVPNAVNMDKGVYILEKYV
jgi:hypothetical protein